MNKDRTMFYIYISIMLIATTSGQIALKYGISSMGEIPSNIKDGAIFILSALSKPLVIISLLLAFIGSLAWISAISKADLSFAYPFSVLSYVFILLISSLILKEHIPLIRWIGVIIIGIGVFLVSRS